MYVCVYQLFRPLCLSEVPSQANPEQSEHQKVVEVEFYPAGHRGVGVAKGCVGEPGLVVSSFLLGRWSNGGHRSWKKRLWVLMGLEGLGS